MKITSNYSRGQAQKNYSPNFKGVNVVQISKKAFKNPENMSSVIHDFVDIFVKESSRQPVEKKHSILDKIIGKFSKTSRVFSYLETPTYANKIGLLEQNNVHGWPLSMLSQKTGLPIKEALNPDYHSFFVLTGKEGKQACKSFSQSANLRTAITIGKEMLEKRISSQEFTELYYNTRVLQTKDDKIEKLIKGLPQQKFTTDTLDDAKTIIGKIMKDA